MSFRNPESFLSLTWQLSDNIQVDTEYFHNGDNNLPIERCVYTNQMLVFFGGNHSTTVNLEYPVFYKNVQDKNAPLLVIPKNEQRKGTFKGLLSDEVVMSFEEHLEVSVEEEKSKQRQMDEAEFERLRVKLGK